MRAHFVYSKNYDISFGWPGRLHPFDGTKFSKAWNLVRTKFKDRLNDSWIEPHIPVSDQLLLTIHSEQYLGSLQQSATIARVIEINLARYFSNNLLQRKLINPLKLACAGTVLAAESALNNKAIAMNFGGGYHHAFADHGEGFCFFADAALSIVNCRQTGLLRPQDKILMIDLDAHRGNGFDAIMGKDSAVRIFDMYNFQAYPGLHQGDPDSYPYLIPLKSGIKDQQYLDILQTELTKFLNENQNAKLVYYNAGNDIYEQDRLGGMGVSYDGVVTRDNMVLTALANRGVPTVVMTSGGYTSASHKLIAELVKIIFALTE